MTTLEGKAKRAVDSLEGALLDFWVAKAAGAEFRYAWAFDGSQNERRTFLENWGTEQAWGIGRFEPSSDWGHGGPFVEKYKIRVYPSIHEGYWDAKLGNWTVGGKTPLIAAMRAFVASKFGGEVDNPEWLQ